MSLRVLHCPVNTAGIPWANVQALRRRGVDAKLVVFERYKLHPEADWSLDRKGGLARQQLTQWRAFLKLLPQYDVFHFYSSVTLVPKSVQFRILHALGKKAVYHYLGSDIRGKTPEQLAYGKKADGEIVGSYDAIRWVPGGGRRPAGDRPLELRAGAAVGPQAPGRPARAVVRAAARERSTSSPRARGSTSTSRSSKASATTRRSSATAARTSSSTS